MNKIFVMCFLFILMISTQTYSIDVSKIPTLENKPYAYRAVYEETIAIASVQIANAPHLPNKLVISPGYYEYEGNVYNLDKPGLYKFFHIGQSHRGEQQRIVYNGDVKTLMSSMAWITSHGESDNSKSQKELEEKALSDKLILTCGPVSGFAIHLLSTLKINARFASTLTLDEWTIYDIGHAMIEVQDPISKRWYLYDLTGKAYFTQNNKQLNLFEFYHAQQKGDFEIVPLSNSTKLDIVGSDIIYYMEKIFSTPRPWYKRIVQVVMIYNYYHCVDSVQNRKRIEDWSPGMVYLTAEKFMKMFYG